jgi:hypothetical protein
MTPSWFFDAAHSLRQTGWNRGAFACVQICHAEEATMKGRFFERSTIGRTRTTTAIVKNDRFMKGRRGSTKEEEISETETQ